MVRLPRTIAIAVVVIAPAAAIAATTSGRVLAINCTTEQYKPKQITLACADGGTYLAKLHWSKWSRSKAFGKGDYSFNDCNPSCVSGHIHSYPVKVTLSKPGCRKEKHEGFRRVALRFEGKQPSGVNTKMTVPCP